MSAANHYFFHDAQLITVEKLLYLPHGSLQRSDEVIDPSFRAPNSKIASKTTV